MEALETTAPVEMTVRFFCVFRLSSVVPIVQGGGGI